ncbi:mRNA cap guanine-N7 methyltransferase [Hamiltosporidium tvaerminnensis]|uniref:mRNA cap guanine-N(7) methyltransferase n=1 Tax=Hamiltosporidium tvaerminnensis TaxID=1176355 RepID=A0A4Q9KXP6_9MICR|nr:mRNA cap guanine-N7 methyltransferase [Hamiltosporidium tvaerminnensis]TBT99732.1 mRNA cap guanine-N7 methyltransferase [Hamiltosporidium tvaerminnensis]
MKNIATKDLEDQVSNTTDELEVKPQDKDSIVNNEDILIEKGEKTVNIEDEIIHLDQKESRNITNTINVEENKKDSNKNTHTSSSSMNLEENQKDSNKNTHTSSSSINLEENYKDSNKNEETSSSSINLEENLKDSNKNSKNIPTLVSLEDDNKESLYAKKMRKLNSMESRAESSRVNRKIATHYDKIQKKTISERKNSKIINIITTNNFIKTILLNKYIKERMDVLDMGCGKGGDLQKYKYLRIKNYLGCDISEESIKEAEKRYLNIKDKYKAEFMLLDVYCQEINLNRSFDIISSQFSLHYGFRNSVTIDNLVKNISLHLRENGYFIATIPDKVTLLNRLKKYGNNYGNEFYKISFKIEKNEELSEYLFTLDGAVDSCPEYLLDCEILKSKFKNENIHLIEEKSFLNFFNENIRINKNLYERMRVKRLSIDELKVIELYKVIVFKKTKNP